MAYIQIVDDNARARRAMAQHLTRQGHCVCEADSAEQAFEYLKTIRFDVVIVDYKLRGSNGMDVLSYVHSLSPKTRKLLITGFPSDEVRTLAEDIGAGYLLKPFGLSELDAKIAEFEIQPADNTKANN